jgi:hypothetical protein
MTTDDRIAAALERIATALEQGVLASLPDPGLPPTASAWPEPPPPTAPPAGEFVFTGPVVSVAAGECPVHHKARAGTKGLYCPTKLPDGTWCQWKKVA